MGPASTVFVCGRLTAANAGLPCVDGLAKDRLGAEATIAVTITNPVIAQPSRLSRCLLNFSPSRIFKERNMMFVAPTSNSMPWTV